MMKTTSTEQGLRIERDDDGRSILVHHNIDLSRVRGGYTGFDSEAFFSCACISTRDKSSDFARIRSYNSDSAVGWYVPILYYSEPEQFIHEKFLADFAYAAYLQQWTHSDLATTRKYLESVLGFEKQEEEFSNLFPENGGFIVISKEAFKREKLNFSDLKISLLHGGLWPYGGTVSFSRLSQIASTDPMVEQLSSRKNIKVKRLPRNSRPVAELICSIIDMAHDEISGIGGFLYLYQIAEYLMEVEFSKLISNVAREETPAWKLKKKLQAFSSESYRLRSIARQATSNGAAFAILDSLGAECKSFLAACGVDQGDASIGEPLEGADNRMWIDWVYAVRNMIVHNHLAILRSGCTERLTAINPLLHRAALELVLHY